MTWKINFSKLKLKREGECKRAKSRPAYQKEEKNSNHYAE